MKFGVSVGVSDMPYVRIRARIRTGAEEVGFRNDDPFELDTNVDSDGRINPHGRMYGAFGNHRNDEYYPFMMNNFGVIDFGYSDGTRGARTDLLNKKIVIGAEFSYRNGPGPIDDNNPEAVLRIDQVNNL